MTTTAAALRDRTAPGPGPGAFAGTAALIRFALRRDRVRLPVWLLALVLGTLATASEYATLYATTEKRAAVAATMDSPAALAMTGPHHYLSDYGIGAMLGHQLLGFMAVLVGLMSVLIVTRHTRNEEETGRAELVRSTVVGHHAQLASALAVAAVANIALAVLLALALVSTRIDGIGSGEALLYGLTHTVIGLVFGIAAVTAQVTAHARGASGMALALIGVAYVLRASGDVGNDALSWLSPIGWIQRTYVFVDNRWWPLLLCLATAALTAATGFVLSTRRDVGAGLRAARPGRRTAAAALTRPFGFALRLHRATLLGFGTGLLLMGVMYGSILGDAADMVKDVEQVQEALAEIGGSSVAESFASMVMVVIAVVAAVYVVMASLRPRAEESAGRAEPLLATGLSRRRWLGGHAAVALAAWYGAAARGRAGLRSRGRRVHRRHRPRGGARRGRRGVRARVVGDRGCGRRALRLVPPRRIGGLGRARVRVPRRVPRRDTPLPRLDERPFALRPRSPPPGRPAELDPRARPHRRRGRTGPVGAGGLSPPGSGDEVTGG